jgi:RNA polymerase sigma-70 factor (ECF subfamily)
MPKPPSDDDLVQEARAGSRAAAELLIRRYERRVYRVCLTMTRNGDDALDLTQEALLRAFSKLDSFQGTGAFQGWLLQVTHRVCLNWLRTRSRRPDTEELTEQSAPSREASQEADLARREEGERLRAALARLNERERIAVRLRYFEEMPVRMVAAALDCSEGTAKNLLFRTLRKLRTRMPAD